MGKAWSLSNMASKNQIKQDQNPSLSWPLNLTTHTTHTLQILKLSHSREEEQEGEEERKEEGASSIAFLSTSTSIPCVFLHH